MSRRGALLLTLLLGACVSGSAAEAPWTELFDGRSLGQFVVTDFGGQGEVAVADGALHLGIGSPLTGVTWTGEPPGGAYELEVVAARRSGTDFFCGLTFPAGEGHLTLVLGGWGGAVCGLSSLDGRDAAHNATRTLRAFAPGREHLIHLAVRPERVAVAVDGEPLLAADLAGRSCTLRAEMLPSRPLGYATFLSSAAVRAARWRPLPP
jgi:hypothetical protein